MMGNPFTTSMVTVAIAVAAVGTAISALATAADAR